MSGEIAEQVKNYILEEFLVGEDPEALTNSTPLITAGIIDSISTLKLVQFLENKYGIQVQAHEMSADNLDTIDEIVRFVESKQ